jgi:hypothetical protein
VKDPAPAAQGALFVEAAPSPEALAKLRDEALKEAYHAVSSIDPQAIGRTHATEDDRTGGIEDALQAARVAIRNLRFPPERRYPPEKA